MLGPRHVIRAAAMQVAIRIGLLVQRASIPRAQHLRDHPLILRFRAVAIQHALRLRQLRRFLDPGFQWSCHPDLPAGPTFRRHMVQSMPRRPLQPGDALGEDPDQVGDVVRMDSAMPTRPYTGGNFRPGWHAYCFYPPTVYVTPRRPRKPLPVKRHSLVFSAAKDSSLHLPLPYFLTS